MKKEIEKALKSYQEECQNMADTFIEWYYCDDDIEYGNIEWFWVADQVGGVLCINDHFWGMDDLLEIFTLRPSVDDLFKWKSQKEEAAFNGKTSLGLKSWLKLNKKT